MVDMRHETRWPSSFVAEFATKMSPCLVQVVNAKHLSSQMVEFTMQFTTRLQVTIIARLIEIVGLHRTRLLSRERLSVERKRIAKEE